MAADDHQALTRALAARRPVWLVLSELYLDTELEDYAYAHIAEVLKASPYTFEEILEIDLQEVFPLLWPNHFATAGVWDGFNEKWLLEGCEKLFHRRKSQYRRIMHRLLNLFFYRFRKVELMKVEKFYRSA